MTARVSPDGEWLAFMSQRSLTGYDNRDAASGEPDEEVYLYGAASERLACASCDPTGARPHGRKYSVTGESAAEVSIPLAGGYEEWGAKTWLAANVPSWTRTGQGRSNPNTDLFYQPRYLSNGGRLFFNSSDGLVPKDVNEQEGVYESSPSATRAPKAGSSARKLPPRVARSSSPPVPFRYLRKERYLPAKAKKPRAVSA